MRLIDAYVFAKKIMKIWDKAESEGRTDIVKVLADIVTPCLVSTPTVEAEPVNHGKWIEDTVSCGNTFDPYKEDYMDVLICSECKEHFDVSEARNFCPNCGARMDGE